MTKHYLLAAMHSDRANQDRTSWVLMGVPAWNRDVTMARPFHFVTLPGEPLPQLGDIIVTEDGTTITAIVPGPETAEPLAQPAALTPARHEHHCPN